MSEMKVGAFTVEITSEDKVLFPESGITKGELADYYRRIADTMIPHMQGRPVTLHRFPNGIEKPGFFQKQISDYFPEYVNREVVEKEEGEIAMAIVDKPATLVYLAQQGTITPHVWLSRVDRPNHPDRLIFDLDPTSGFEDVRMAAKMMREIIEELGLIPFVMTTGSRGMHVTIPIDRKVDFDTARAFAEDIASVLSKRFPDRFTTQFSKAKRGKRLFLDTRRNAYAQTGVAPYAVRAKPNAPVATPLIWDEVDDADLTPNLYTIQNIFERLEKMGDPWKDIAQHARPITAARRRCAEMIADSV